MSEDKRSRVTISIHRGVLLVESAGRLESIEDARAVQASIEAEGNRARATRLLLDNRGTLAPAQHLGDAMREWVQRGPFDAVAFVLDSELLRVSVNMDSLGAGKRTRAFPTRTAALEWLLDQPASPVQSSPPPRSVRAAQQREAVAERRTSPWRFRSGSEYSGSDHAAPAMKDHEPLATQRESGVIETPPASKGRRN